MELKKVKTITGQDAEVIDLADVTGDAHRFIRKKCRGCGAATSVLATEVRRGAKLGGNWYRAWRTEGGAVAVDMGSGAIVIPCRKCGIPGNAERVGEKLRPDIRCNAKCHASKGPHCDCSCGGKNHGKSYG